MGTLLLPSEFQSPSHRLSAAKKADPTSLGAFQELGHTGLLASLALRQDPAGEGAAERSEWLATREASAEFERQADSREVDISYGIFHRHLRWRFALVGCSITEILKCYLILNRCNVKSLNINSYLLDCFNLLGDD